MSRFFQRFLKPFSVMHYLCKFYRNPVILPREFFNPCLFINALNVASQGLYIIKNSSSFVTKTVTIAIVTESWSIFFIVNKLTAINTVVANLRPFKVPPNYQRKHERPIEQKEINCLLQRKILMNFKFWKSYIYVYKFQ